MTKLVVIIGFCLAFAAGLTVGISRQRQLTATTQPSTRPSHRGFLPSELNLSPQQQEQLRNIWSDMSHGREEQEKTRQQLLEKRNEAIAALIRPEDKQTYEKAMQDYRDGIAEMDRAARGRFQEKVRQTNEILTPEQRAKYEEFLSRHSFRGPGGPGGRERGRATTQDRRNESASTTHPAH